MKKFFIKSSVVITVFICLALVYYLLLYPMVEKTTPKNDYIHIPKNSNLRQITEILHENKIIKHKLSFYITAWVMIAKNNYLKSGYYAFNKGNSLFKVIRTLQIGQSHLFIFTILEGWNHYQVIENLKQSPIKNEGRYEDYINDKELLDKIKFKDIKNIEGFLFPDTYYLAIDSSEKEILLQFIDNFNKNLPAEFLKKAFDRNLTPYKMLILASIIAKETSIKEDKYLVSSVFYNRLKNGMRLQADPTVIYGTKKFNRLITKKDLRTKTPYNTYTNYGLPPTPISNPGLQDILAAMNPKNSDYLYFVASNKGGKSVFSKDLKSHINAVNNYRRLTR